MQVNSHEPKSDDQHLLKYAAFNSSFSPQSNKLTNHPPESTLSLENKLTTSEIAPVKEAELNQPETDEPLKIKTKKSPLWVLPLPKLLIVATGIGLILLILLAITQGMTRGVRIVPDPTPPSPAPVNTADPQTQNGTLQTEVMVGKQGSELEKWNHPGATKVHPAAPVTPATPTTPAAPAPAHVISASAYTPPPVAQSYTRPKSETPPTNFTPVPKQSATPPPQDPQKEWIEAANEGSFGGTSSDTRKAADQSLSGITTTSVSSPNTGNGQIPVPTGSQLQVVQPQITAQAQTGLQYQRSLNSSDPTKQLIVGTQGEGRVDTTIRWSSFQSLQSQTLVIKVTQALPSPDSKLAVIPPGSYLTAQILNTDANGFLELSLVSVNLNINGQIQLTPTSLPPGAIQVLSKKGDSLQAKFHGPKNGSSFLSILGNAASATGIGGNSSSLSALNALPGRQYSSSQNVYFSLDQGTPVRLYVKQSFSL